MTTNAMLEKYKPLLLNIILEYVPECKVYLFGSRARQTHRNGADVDIALDAGKTIDVRILLKVSGEIEESSIPVFVDVVDFNTVKKSMQEEIVKDGILWTE